MFIQGGQLFFFRSISSAKLENLKKVPIQYYSDIQI